MKIIIDSRETDLYKQCIALQSLYNLESSIAIASECLPLGDVIIRDDSDKELLIFERKKVSDLAASIHDGRYKEQSLRLQATQLHNHNVIYLVEGSLSGYKLKWGRIDKTALYSALVSLQVYKGFSTIRSDSLAESAEYVIRFANKIGKTGNTPMFYTDMTSDCSGPPDLTKYSSAIKRVKKDNINKDTIHGVWLGQLPGVSNNVADIVLSRHSTLWGLREALKADANCLDDIVITTSSGKTRALGKNVIETIKTHLLEQ